MYICMESAIVNGYNTRLSNWNCVPGIINNKYTCANFFTEFTLYNIYFKALNYQMKKMVDVFTFNVLLKIELFSCFLIRH